MRALTATLLVSALVALAQGRPQDFDFDDGSSEEDGRYNFEWRVNAFDSLENELNFGQQESLSDEVTRGSYYVLLPDTRMMRVEYFSDSTGYHPTITYEGNAAFLDSDEFF